MEQDKIAEICLRLISNAGEGRAHLSEALKAFVRKDYRLAEEQVELAETYLAEAHKIQFAELMAPQQKGETIPFNLLLIHAMDILMIGCSERDTLKAMIEGVREAENV
jgi:cellobiose-specific phosphotransferase system component IIA